MSEKQRRYSADLGIWVVQIDNPKKNVADKLANLARDYHEVRIAAICGALGIPEVSRDRKEWLQRQVVCVLEEFPHVFTDQMKKNIEQWFKRL